MSQKRNRPNLVSMGNDIIDGTSLNPPRIAIPATSNSTTVTGNEVPRMKLR